jgi:hypothetical protein
MKYTFISILIFSFTISYCQPKTSFVLIDDSSLKTSNPYKNQLDSLYPQSDSMEIFYVPKITPPRLFTLSSKSSDTLFLSQTDQNGNFLTQKLWDYFEETDSTLYKGLISVKFRVQINWDGKIFYIEATDIHGHFVEGPWRSVWKRIQSIPSKQDGILNDYGFTQQLKTGQK